MNTPARRALERLAEAGTCPFAIDADAEGTRLRRDAPRIEFRHSFVAGPIARRARQSNQALLRACRDRKRTIASVLDLTAGWGADALVLANHGYRVDLVERDALLHAVVAHAIECLGADPDGAACAARMRCHHADSRDFLESLAPARRFDCIYLDPMFPPHKSGARPGKEMQLLQQLTANAGLEACFELALQRARNRVVVKRPAKAPALTAREPDIVYREKTIRFDVYLTA